MGVNPPPLLALSKGLSFWKVCHTSVHLLKLAETDVDSCILQVHQTLVHGKTPIGDELERTGMMVRPSVATLCIKSVSVHEIGLKTTF